VTNFHQQLLPPQQQHPNEQDVNESYWMLLTMYPPLRLKYHFPSQELCPQAIGDKTNVSATSADLSRTLGLTLNEEQQYSLSEQGLDVDTLRYISEEEQTLMDKKLGVICSFGEDDGMVGSVQLYDNKKGSSSSNGKGGVVVSRVIRGSIAWNAGVRAGDRIVATSATVGDKMWPKSTLDGVRSAISSRKVMSSTMKFQLQRSSDTLLSETELVQEFELSLSRPMGINIEDTPDGYVRISGFTDDAPKKVTDKLQVGDRIIAADSSLGNKLWPISNVDGAVSAVTSRLPGQPVQLRFERVIEKGTDLTSVQSLKEESSTTILARDLLQNYSKYQSGVISKRTLSASSEDAISSDIQNEQLLSRCRDVLKRYIYVYDPTADRNTGVPALVADRVLEALAAASASLDAKTLSLLMNAYIKCKKPKEALRIFEATIGLAADGSSKVVNDIVIKGKEKGQIVPNRSGLNLYTATDLIRAHSILGDSSSALRVLCAIEGDEMDLGEVKAINWETTFKADTKFYNTVLAAVSKSETASIDIVKNLYSAMCEPVLFNTPRPKKNVVTYNTMISAYARNGKRQDAFVLLNEMLEAGLKPDKFTITSLVKVVVDDGDVDTALGLLSDMKKAGIKSDAVGYNTVIRSLCDRSKWFEPKSLVADMEARGISPDAKTYGLLMNGLLKLNKPGPCLTLFESACSDQRTAALTENVQLYTTAITAAATLGDYERALELVSRMTFAGVKPNMKTLTSLTGACLTGENYKYALDVYKKIEKPDGYAMLLGVRAYCKSGEFGTALNLVDGNELMTGKQIMSSYNYIIASALEEKDYLAAKKAMDNLLKNGYIPSKMTFRKILESLYLLKSKEKKARIFGNQSDNDEEIEKFKYLLSVLDAIEGRKLHSTGQMYSCILSQGATIGGVYRKIASLIQIQRSGSAHLQVQINHDENEETSQQTNLTRWSDILENYSDYKTSIKEKSMKLPFVRVRINQRELRQVLFAEQGVTYGGMRKSNKNLAMNKR